MAEEPRTLTRSRVAAALGVSIATIRRAESSGVVSPEVGADGVRRFGREDINRLKAHVTERARARAPARSRGGELAAAAWRSIAAGAGAFELVTELRVTPDEARALLASYAEPGAVVLSAAVVRALAAEGFGDSSGRISGASMLAAARQLRAAVRARRALPARRQA